MYMYYFINTFTSQIQTFYITTAGTINNVIYISHTTIINTLY